MALIWFGTTDPLNDGRPMPGVGPVAIKTTFHPEQDTLDEMMRSITHEDGFWVRHSASPVAWIESEDDHALAALLADRLGCPVGRPDDWPPNP